MRIPAAAYWIAGVGLLVGFSWMYKGETTTFYGVAEASETAISVESAVEVLSIRVIPGQDVQTGDTLVCLRRPDLALRISALTRELDGSTGKMSVSSSEIDQRVGEAKAALETRRNQLQFEIKRLLDERARNRELASRLQSLPQGTPPSDSNDVIMQRVRAMESEISTLERNTKDQIALLQGSQGLQRQTGKVERAALEQELNLLRIEEAKLTILAKEAGVVGSVNVHEGEKVSPFDPILTLTAHSPTLVRGYIPEKVYNRIAMGDSVMVEAVSEHGGILRGQVVGVGSRIVEFPVRLRKIPDLIVWGREVMVRIPEQNDYLLGEMVSIHPAGIAAQLHLGKTP